jgi:tetratricopeptide (TPR) repeat protein
MGRWVLLVCCAANVAHADTSAELFAQAQALKAQGKLDAACEKYEASYKLDPAPGTMLNLGDCAERRGELARALKLYQDAEHAFAAAGSAPRAAYSHNRAVAVQARLRPPEPAPAAPTAAPAPEPAASPPPADDPETIERNRRIARIVAISGFATAAVAVPVIYLFEYRGPILTYEQGVPARDVHDNALGSEDCGNLDAAVVGGVAQWRAACHARTRMFIEGAFGLVGLAAGGVALIYRYKIGHEASVAIVPTRSGAALAWRW